MSRYTYLATCTPLYLYADHHSHVYIPVLHLNLLLTTYQSFFFLSLLEWSQSEIITLLSLDLKIAAFVAIVSVIYLAGALTVGFIVWKNLLHYKSGFI